MCLALAQPPPIRSPPAHGGALGVLQLSQQHPQSCPSPDARRWLVRLTIREFVVAAAASQPIITWHHFPRSLVCICLASASRPKPDAWLRIMQVGRRSHLVERNGGGFPPVWHSNWACLQRVSPPPQGNLVRKEPPVDTPPSGQGPPVASLLPCSPRRPGSGLRWQECPAAWRAGAVGKGSTTCTRKCGAGNGRLWGRGQSGHGAGSALISLAPGRGGGGKPGFSFALRR